ncbi:MAG: histidine kinase [Bacteroidales bacterium]|nr:histidine kinase [Bacteroidales bacterium]
MNRTLRKYSTRIAAAILIHFIIKIFDETFNDRIFVLDQRGVLFLVYFISFILIVWEAGDVLYRYSVRTFLRKYEIIKQVTLLMMVYLVYGVFVMVLFTVSYSLFDLILFNLPHYGHPTRFFDFDANVGMYIAYVGVLVFIGQIYVFNHWKKERLMSEQLQKENFQAKFEALKNQIDPHFFFNNLSVLTSLVYKNPDLAAEYINQLSKIYRYILDKRDELLVPLSEELTFLDSYFFLIKIRHEEHITFNTSLNESTGTTCFLPPNTLQMLIENAIKHNRFSDEEPLEITISENHDFLLIENTLNRRRQMESTLKIGLENIKKRYELLGLNSVVVLEEEGKFIVSLPKIGKEIYENSNIRR